MSQSAPSLWRLAGRLTRAAMVLAMTVAVGRAAWVYACGPFLTSIDTTNAGQPSDLARYARGDLGIVEPTFARRYLVQTYRVLNGQPPLANIAPAPERQRESLAPPPPLPAERWRIARDRVLLPPNAVRSTGSPRTDRRIGDYQYILNCQDDAFTTATRTLEDRRKQFGLTTAVREWAEAQDAVFENCDGSGLVLPTPPSSQDPLRLADFDYQTAAAYFYATQYEEAARRFQAIGNDPQSPWQPYGQYLAGRALIRDATVPDRTIEDRDARLRRAADALRAALADRRALALHESAGGLLNFIDVRVRRFERLEALSTRLASAPTVDEQELVDYRYLLRLLLGDAFRYDDLAERDRIAATHELNEWMLVAQDLGDAALARGLARWRASRSPAWLAAVLWKVPPDHPALDEILAGVDDLAPTSPIYTTAVLRKVQLLLDGERTDEARRLLDALPRRPQSGFDREAVNLASAARFRAAATFDELLAYAPRVPLDSQFAGAVFDQDAGQTFTLHLPLDRLVEAAVRPVLPDRLRIRVASAAFARAFVLGRPAAARQAAEVLRALAPPLRPDLDRYLAAPTDEAARRAGVYLMLRTPGLRAHVRGRDDNITYARTEPIRQFEHMFRDNWWCAAEIGAEPIDPDRRGSAAGDWRFVDRRGPAPRFLTDVEREAAARELAQLAALGSPQGYLADEAIAWARAAPHDLRAAEALALAVEGGRWSCSVEATSRRAFQTLHRLFPKSEWAARTKYWYRGQD